MLAQPASQQGCQEVGKDIEIPLKPIFAEQSIILYFSHNSLQNYAKKHIIPTFLAAKIT